MDETVETFEEESANARKDSPLLNIENIVSFFFIRKKRSTLNCLGSLVMLVLSIIFLA